MKSAIWHTEDRVEAMAIIALIYVLITWLVFFRFKLLPWNWPWRIVCVLLGVGILCVFLALLNTLTPSGRTAVIGRVVEVTPNVMGTVISVSAEPYTLIKKGAILFQIDPTPYDAKVRQLKASVAEAKQKVEQYKTQVDLAVADVAGLSGQLDYATKRRTDIATLASTSATSEFRLQDAAAQVEQLTAQLQAARAREANARLVLGSEIDGQNTTVAQLAAQLDNAQWELEQTTIRAASDGYASAIALVPGARAVPFRAALSFIIADDLHLEGVFEQQGYVSIRKGTPVKVVFANLPARVFNTQVIGIAPGIAQGQVAVSGTVFRSESVGTSTTFPVEMKIPDGIDPGLIRMGVVGTATVVSPGAGPIGILATILLWAKAFLVYL